MVIDNRFAEIDNSIVVGIVIDASGTASLDGCRAVAGRFAASADRRDEIITGCVHRGVQIPPSSSFEALARRENGLTVWRPNSDADDACGRLGTMSDGKSLRFGRGILEPSGSID